MTLTTRTATAAALALGLAVIAFALFTQYGQGYQPCELCLRERLPWYAAIAVGVVGVVFPDRRLLALIGILFLVSVGLGLHHAGVEQHWWAGPGACTSGSLGARTIDELKAMMHQERIIQCDQIAWSFLGLSMAAWNGVVSLIAAGAILTFMLRGRHAG